MNVDPDTFLRHFDFSIRNPLPGVNARKRYTCPLHQDSDCSLTIYDGTDTVFKCVHPACGFMGDAVSLVALSRKITFRAAIDLFRPGGEFSDCVRGPLRTEDIDSYIENAGSQAELKTYLARCRRALKQSPEKARIRPGMSVTSAKLLHPCVGLFLESDVPKPLAEFTKPKYRGACFILYPYTKDGDVTRIDVVDSNNPVFRRTVVVTHPSLGVFGEELLDLRVRTIMVADRPEAACAMYSTWMQTRATKPAIVSFHGYPLPESFSDTKSIAVVSTVDSDASDEYLVRMMSAPEIVRGKNPSVKVAKIQKKAVDVSVTELELMSEGKLRAAKPLHEHVSIRLLDMARHGQEQEIVGLLAKEQTPIIARSILKSYLEKLASERPGDGLLVERLCEAMSSDRMMLSGDIVLANGRSIHMGSTELSGHGARGICVLCNVGLSVESKIVSYDGKTIYVCSVACSDGSPSVSVRIPDDAACKVSSLQSIVVKAFSERGYNPYIAFYSVPGYSWPDILSKLSEHCQVKKEVNELGLDSASDIQLPEVTVHANGEASRQERVFTMPDDVLRVYAGIPYETDATCEPYERLVARCDNMYVAAFALGVFHVAYQMVYGMFRPDVVKSHMMRHFFYVETEPGIWGRVFKQVADLFSGNDYTPTVNYSDPMKTFRDYGKLGCLPLIAYVPTIGNKLSAALDSTKVDLLGIADTSTAVMMNGKLSAVYVTPSYDAPMDRGIIGGQDIDSLRNSFVPFISRFIREARIDTAFRSSSVPCISVYDKCCRMFGIERSQLVDSIAKNYFPGVGMTGFTVFCDLVHRSITEDASPRITVVDGAPQRGYSFTRRGQHVFVMRDCVVISHMVVDMLNQSARGKYKFDVEQLTDEMETTGMLAAMPDLGIDESRCWCISRETWETRMVRPPINLAAEVTNGTIGLKPLK